MEAADLLTDFVARPRVDPEELERERGVVVQEIARANDQPAVMAEHLIDEAAFGDHPLGRPVLGPPEHIRESFTRDGILAFRTRRWAPHRWSGLPGGQSGQHWTATSRSSSPASPSTPSPAPFEPAPPLEPRVLVRERDSSQSHLRMSYRS